MKTRVAALALALAALAGCVENNASVELYDICAPPDDANKCGMSGGCGAYLASPRPWVATTVNGYVNELDLFVEIRNQTPNNEDTSSGRENNNDFDIDEYEMSYEVFTDTNAPLAITLPVAIEPANATIPANGVAAPIVPIIPAPRMAALMAFAPPHVIVVAEVIARGRLGGTSYETGAWPVAVDVYNTDFSTGSYFCKADEMLWNVCPNVGQSSTWSCMKVETAPTP